MPTIPHLERHFTGSARIRDVVIGMSDGLTVPFALAAGLSGAIASTRIVVTAGLAEVAAGAIAMGLGGYLAARGDRDHYQSELARERSEVVDKTEFEVAEVEDIFAEYGVDRPAVAPVIAAFRTRPEDWVRFMMRFELGLEEPDPRAALWSALTIAVSYIVGGFIPLSPYFFSATTRGALGASVGMTLVALLIFGFTKGRFTGARPVKSAIQTVLIGGLAAGAAFILARLLA
jgi:VIT1/CCC1 family predicted Fe2+/Mn2+ transporter